MKDQKTDVFVQCNNWRPYYYDMYNRVGNLTILSLVPRLARSSSGLLGGFAYL